MHLKLAILPLAFALQVAAVTKAAAPVHGSSSVIQSTKGFGSSSVAPTGTGSSVAPSASAVMGHPDDRTPSERPVPSASARRTGPSTAPEAPRELVERRPPTRSTDPTHASSAPAAQREVVEREARELEERSPASEARDLESRLADPASHLGSVSGANSENGAGALEIQYGIATLMAFAVTLVIL